MASTETDKKKVLGRGLASLIPGASQQPSGARRDYFLCDIEKIVPNTYQPRKLFDKQALEELVESIKAHGIIQPLIVQVKDGHYELVAGERRWRAAQKAGLQQVPVVVKDVDGNASSLEMAIIENVQRSDLNCIEEAIAYQQLMDEFQLSQEDIAVKVGKNRATIANTIRLLKLPTVLREDLAENKLSMGHARALLGLERVEDQLSVREEIHNKKLSVRETEKRVNEILAGKAPESNAGQSETSTDRDVHIVALEDNLRRHYGTKVQIKGTDKKGVIQLVYTSREDLTRLGEALMWNFNS